nr:MAG TPA: hypothetical protein [Inoviridae sp.]
MVVSPYVWTFYISFPMGLGIAYPLAPCNPEKEK